MNFCKDCKYCNQEDKNLWRCERHQAISPVTGEIRNFTCDGYRTGSDAETCRTYEPNVGR